MSRIAACFEKLKNDNKKALIPYLVCGDPLQEVTLPAMHALVKSGADVIELGVPFSDPMAEGPTIQKGHERALANHTSLRSTLATVKAFRQTDSVTPVVLMGYANPVERMGYDEFATLASEAGVDGLLIVDMPPEESVALNAILKKAAIDIIFLIAPTTTIDRQKQIAATATGYIYYVSLRGVTGAGHLDSDEVRTKIAQIRSATDLPLCVGFGIKDGQSARNIAAMADGAVVGSVLVQKMADMAASGADVDSIVNSLAELLAEMRSAIDT
ncbi:MAG: tryptophan synthase subunit alpha [Pseudomonadales bacterium]|nr:tryptophan synthase subunit alpha [Pseudomonadales bacterium]